ncbi:hypothetical protein PR202_gb06326 [Eleusine coracana subsp. coracana]|uniref:Uncharacterized protein n=1 Tax=Eleusine coracana subsp. coracana TaxID=191504 RepID=A0AAV5E9N0_ELECO|nr:hypothetical protein PR202_gb06326 [Eleusine coracana subsp. coracana]
MAASSPAAPLVSTLSIAARKSFLPSPITTPCPRSRHRLRAGSVKQWREFEDDAGAVKEWREFEDAVRRKDLSRALRFLQSVEPQAGAAAMQVAVPVPPGRDWEVLDTCIDANDMRLVGRAYQFLTDRGVLASFGKCKNIVLEGPREVTPTVLKEMTGLEAVKLAPKKWGLSGKSPYVLIGFLGGVSYLLTQGIDVRPNLGAVLALATADALFLGGTCLAQISSFWPPYKRRILVHEAGHLLTGTQFWDEKMEKELAEGHLSSTAFDRYCMVLFSGIAAEALVYGEAEGGENDENLFRSLCILLDPPLSVAQVVLHNSKLEVQEISTRRTHTNVSALNASASLDESKLKFVFCTYKGLSPACSLCWCMPSEHQCTVSLATLNHGIRALEFAGTGHSRVMNVSFGLAGGVPTESMSPVIAARTSSRSQSVGRQGRNAGSIAVLAILIARLKTAAENRPVLDRR